MKKFIIRCLICAAIIAAFGGICKIEGTAPERIKHKVSFLLDYNIDYEETFSDIKKGMVKGWKKVQQKD